MIKHPAILILGGTGEARDLAAKLSELPVRVITSLAGRTRKPADIPGEIHAGGFGGVAGLSRFLAVEDINLVVDATHPFAEKISRNAMLACAEWQVARLRLERPAWQPQPGDHWLHAASLEEAARLLPSLCKRPLITVGSNDFHFFRDVQGVEIFARMIEEPPFAERPPKCQLILERGPFDHTHEMALFSRHRIDLLVTKNSGGSMIDAKLDAARERGLPVLMIDRPVALPGPCATTATEALDWLKTKLDF
ncbi:cobalt-precorrin-6A reductase [Aestuariispira insulae]|nr:cobalt-precorrin-6A reductase [Aestuariispira insulae]